MHKKVLLISFYGRVCLSTKILSSILRGRGHDTYMIYFKDDRSVPVESFMPDSKSFQFLCSDRGGGIYGTGLDVNPPTEEELQLLEDKALEIKPHVVAIISRSVHLDLSRIITNRLRKILPHSRFIAGGYGPSLESEKFLEFVDYVCIGKGDSAIVDMVEKEDPSVSPNVGCIIDGMLHISKLEHPDNLDSRPFADWSLDNKFMIEDNEIFSLHTKYDAKTYGIIASEGCPSTCTYCQACQWPTIYGLYGGTAPKVIMRTPQNVINELSEAIKQLNIEIVHFMDSIFTWNKKWLDEFLGLYVKHIKLPFVCFTDPRFTTIEQIEKLKNSGMFSTTIGIQSVNEKVRKEIMGRHLPDKEIIDYAWGIVRKGVLPTYDIILFNPFENNESLAEGVNFLRQLPKSNRIFTYELKLFPKSKITNMVHERNPVPLTVNEYLFWSWIFIMILRSRDTDSHIDRILKDKKYRENPYLIKNLYLDIISKMTSKERLIAIRKILKNEILRPTMFVEKENSDMDGVVGEDRHYISGKVANRDILPGELLRYKDFYTSYQEK